MNSVQFISVAGIQCGFPAEIPNGQYQLLNGTVGYMSRVIYSCDQGYELIGRAHLTCDIDERWNGPPPRCEGITVVILLIIMLIFMKGKS
jgi:hypothetical protein